ncbi:MAG TPA: MFS transporter [Thermoleophilaceae bacterium]|nr:MFS transporter [Thermoleophilaceae bacterium]
MRARVAITAIFALNGFLFGTLFSRLPALRERAELSHGEIGLLLLCSTIGLFLMQPLAGALTARLGSKRVVVIGALGYSLGLVPISFAATPAALAPAFVLIGMGSGILDVSMNVQGVAIENRLGRPILASLHAAFSFGGLGGALAGSVAAALDVGLEAHFVVVAALGVVVTFVARRDLIEEHGDEARRGPLWARPTRKLAALGALAFCVLLAEGAVNDWIALYFKEHLGATSAVAAIALATFALAEATGRLLGDRATVAFGASRLAQRAALLGAGGFGLALAASVPLLAAFGLLAAGLGIAVLFPLTLRAAAAQPGSSGPAIAAVSSVGYVGFVVGPPLIGGLAELVSLRAALLIVVAVCVAASALGRNVRSSAASG